MNLMRKKSYLQSLIEQGEGLHLDFKYAVNDSKKIARSLSAFANTDGGIVLLGVRDNGSIAGVRSEEEFYMIQAASEMYTKPSVTFELKQHNVGDKTVLEIIIPKSTKKPHFAPDLEGKLKAYVRVKDENIAASSLLMKIWKKENSDKPAKISFGDSESVLLEFLEANTRITMSKFCRIAEISRFRAERIILELISARIITYELEGQNLFFKSLENS